MRRLLLTFSALVAVGVVAAPAAVAQGPAEDSVTGSGDSSFCSGEFLIDVRSGPSGESPTGQVTCGTFFNGPVTCLNVQGNVALLTIQTNQFGSVALRVIDNGGGPADSVEAFPGSGCAQPQPTYVPVGFRGAIVIVDAPPRPPLPTSKNQCKNGGWRSFGVFKNQGDCVSFVATGGKNAPAGGSKR
jgi:hypothetical protein